jgi:CubicO group peptidase (beta-lactamase class C family)
MPVFRRFIPELTVLVCMAHATSRVAATLATLNFLEFAMPPKYRFCATLPCTLLLSTALLTACGGGSGGSITAPAVPAAPAAPAVPTVPGVPTTPQPPVAQYHDPVGISSSGQNIALLPALGQPAVGTPAIPAAMAGAIDQALQATLRNGHIPGAAIAVLQDGKLVYGKSYGYANLEQRTPLQAEQRMVIGSLSKQFVAVAVLMLVESGQIGLDEKVSRYLGTVPAGWSAMTIRQLLTHTSGLAHLPPDSFTYYQLDALPAKSEDEKLALLEAFPVAQSAGQGYLYSNLGYDALGYVIAKVTGQHYFAFMQQRIFGPLGMTSARLIKPGAAERAQGYLVRGGLDYAVSLSDGAWVGTALASTGLEMNVLDMAKWDAALNGEQLLKPATLAQMWSRQSASDVPGEAYGLGWGLRSAYGQRQIFHTGTVAAFTTDYRRYPDAHFSVIVLTNKSDNPDSLDIATQITRILQPNWGV